MKKILSITISFFIAGSIFSQNVGINTTGATPDASAILDVDASDKGVLIPRVSLTSTASNAPIGAGITTSLLVYNKVTVSDVTPGFYYWNGTIWVRLINTDEAWGTLGNTGTVAGTNFIGTTDAVDFVVKTAGTERMRVNGVANAQAGFVGIGTAAPIEKLHVNGTARAEGFTIIGPDPTALTVEGGQLSLEKATNGLENGALDMYTFGAPINASGLRLFVGGTMTQGLYVSDGKYQTIGNIGIGTVNPQALLHTNGGDVVMVGANGNIANIGTADVLAVTDATKWPINAYATGTNAGAGFFKISNAANVKPAIDIKNAGTGEGVLSTSTGTGYAFRGQTNTAITTTLFTNNYNGGNARVIDAQYNGSNTSGNIAVLGTASLAGGGNGTGVRGEGGFTGVYGKQITGGSYAGYFNGTTRVIGSLSITGTISKGAGTFLIDHPLDPENKYLYHSFVESPDMMNVYNGNITTNSDGVAIVTLPDYFEALNMDYRYQLTVIGQFAQVIVLEKVVNNQFVIKSNIPNIEVSWQVTGVRNDNFAKNNRVIPVVDKAEDDKGYYLYPEVYGEPKSKQIGYEADQKANIKHVEAIDSKGKQN